MKLSHNLKAVHWFGKQARRAAGTLIIACAALLSAPVMADVHPYQKYADEFGLDLNVSYDGTRVMEMEGGSFEFTERKAPGKMYTEVFMGNMSSGILLREDLGKGYLLMHSMGMYKETSLEEAMSNSANGMTFQSIEKAGREDVIGHPSTKYKLRFEDKEGKGAGFMWITDTGVPIKMDMIYSNKDVKGQRITMAFTELNIREQDPAVFELPDGLQPMNFGNMAGLSGILQGAQQQPQAQPESPPPSAAEIAKDNDMSSSQQACLEEKIRLAEEEKEKSKKKRAFGKLLGAVASAAGRFGSSDIARTASDVYAVNATADTVSQAAKDLGLTEQDIEDCRNPGG